MRDEFLRFQEEHSPVKIRNVSTSLNFQTKEDLCVGNGSLIENVNNSDVHLEYASLHEEESTSQPSSQIDTIINLEKITDFTKHENGTKVKVSGKFVVIKETKRKFSPVGKRCI